jgi:hypothetical protein
MYVGYWRLKRYMLDVFLCHAEADAEAAATLATRLEQTAEAKVALECLHPGATVNEMWDAGTGSAAILLLLSPDSVPQRVVRAEWQPLLEHVEANSEPPLGCVLVRDCAFPPLLRRRNFFRWEDDPARAVQRWVIGLHPEPGQAPFAPASIPWFVGRRHEIEALFAELVDRCGTLVMTGEEKSSLAQEFACRASDYFRDILWVDCAGRSASAIWGDIAWQCGAVFDGSVERIMSLVQSHRLLLVLDGAGEDLPLPCTAPGRASILAVKDVPGDCPAPPDKAADLRLWQAMACCHAGAFPIDLAARISRTASGETREACERLIERRLVRPFDANRFRLDIASRVAGRAAAGAVLRSRHAREVHRAFSPWTAEPARCAAYLPEVTVALAWAIERDWSLAALGFRVSDYLRAHQRLVESAEILRTLRAAAEDRADWPVVENCDWELSWIEGRAYRPMVVQADEAGQLSLF